MAARAGLQNEDMEFVQFHPTGEYYFSKVLSLGGIHILLERRTFLCEFSILKSQNKILKCFNDKIEEKT